MPGAAATLQTPVLLIAMPQVLDPFFHRSVVLLLQHDDDGSTGFIVNRPTGIKVSEILSGMEVTWKGPDDAVAHFGGPVQPQLGTVLFGTPEADGGSGAGGDLGAGKVGAAAAAAAGGDAFAAGAATEVFTGVSLTQHVGDLARLAEAPPARFRLFLGYAGWAAGQLIDEILRNDWLTAPVRGDLIFAPDPERVWAATLESVGVNPATLPSWTPSGNGEETAN